MSPNDSRSAVARNTAGFLLVGASASLYTLATVPLLTRWLEPSAWGFYAALAQVNTLLQFAALALFSQSLLKFHVEYEGDERRRFVGTLLLSVFVLQVVLLGGLYLTRHSSMRVLFANLTLPLDPALGWACLWFFAAPLRAFCYSLLRVQERIRALIALNVAYGVFLFPGLAVLVGMREGGVTGAIQAMALAEWLGLGAALVMVAREIRFSFVGSYLSRCIRFAGPLMVGSIIVVVVNNLDRMALSRHVDLAELGVYSVGAMIGNGLALVVTAATTSASTRIVKVMWNEGAERAGDLASATAVDMLVIIGTPFALICLAGDVIVAVLGRSGAEWRMAGAVIIGIATGHFVRGLYLTAQNVLFYAGKSRLLLMNNILLLVLALILAPLLASAGSTGICWLLACCFLLLAPVTHRWASKLMPFHFEWSAALWPTVGVLACMAIALATWRMRIAPDSLPWWGSRALGVALLAWSCGPMLRRLFFARVARQVGG